MKGWAREGQKGKKGKEEGLEGKGEGGTKKREERKGGTHALVYPCHLCGTKKERKGNWRIGRKSAKESGTLISKGLLSGTILGTFVVPWDISQIGRRQSRAEFSGGRSFHWRQSNIRAVFRKYI